MSKLFQVYILAADRAFYEGPRESLVVPTIQGQYGILTGHSNMIAAVAPGILQHKIPEQPSQTAAVSTGLVKAEGGDVLVLVDTAERPEDIDKNRVKWATDEAKEEILQKKSIQEYRSAQASLARAINRLRIKQRNFSDK